MSTIVAWLLPMVLAALGHMVDAWAQNTVGAGGIAGTLAGVWIALHVHPNGVNGPARDSTSKALIAPDGAPAPENAISDATNDGSPG